MTTPINVIKFCPVCGSGRFYPDSGRSFKCEQCGFHFFINASAAVAALIVNEKGELLLAKRALEPNKGMLDLPGGFVDPGERIEEAVRREIKEELNLIVGEIQYLTSWPNEYVFSDYTVYTIDLGFICKVADFSTIGFHDDISGYIFVNPYDIDESKICSESILRIIQYYREST